MSRIIAVVPRHVNKTGLIGPEFVAVAGVTETTLPYGFLSYDQPEGIWKIMTIKDGFAVFCEELPRGSFLRALPQIPNCTLLISEGDYNEILEHLHQAGHTIELVSYQGVLSTNGW